MRTGIDALVTGLLLASAPTATFAQTQQNLPPIEYKTSQPGANAKLTGQNDILDSITDMANHIGGNSSKGISAKIGDWNFYINYRLNNFGSTATDDPARRYICEIYLNNGAERIDAKLFIDTSYKLNAFTIYFYENKKPGEQIIEWGKPQTLPHESDSYTFTGFRPSYFFDAGSNGQFTTVYYDRSPERVPKSTAPFGILIDGAEGWTPVSRNSLDSGTLSFLQTKLDARIRQIHAIMEQHGRE